MRFCTARCPLADITKDNKKSRMNNFLKIKLIVPKKQRDTANLRVGGNVFFSPVVCVCEDAVNNSRLIGRAQATGQTISQQHRHRTEISTAIAMMQHTQGQRVH